MVSNKKVRPKNTIPLAAGKSCPRPLKFMDLGPLLTADDHHIMGLRVAKLLYDNCTWGFWDGLVEGIKNHGVDC